MDSEPTNTDFSKRCDLLNRFWMEFREEEAFESYFEYNDIGVPLAFAISEGIVKSTDQSAAYINEAYDLLCETLNIEIKTYDSLEDMMMEADGFNA